MTQTTGAKSLRNVKVYHSSTSDSVWTDISGVFNAIEVAGGERQTDVLYPADTQRGIVRLGKFTPYEITGKIIYSESSVEAFVGLEALQKTCSRVRLCWQPGGASAGGLSYMTGTDGALIHVDYPGGRVEDGQPILLQFTLRCNTVAHERIAGSPGIPEAYWGILTETGENLTDETGAYLLQESEA